jgi:hypothetical protein
MGLSRDTFYRYKSAVESGGVEALYDQSRRKPNHKNRVEESIELAVKDYALEYPAHGQQRTSNELGKQGVFVSPSGVRSIWLRYDLANFKDRLKSLEEKVASEGLILTESQVAALERKKFDDEVEQHDYQLWPLTTSTTRKPRCNLHKQTVFASASIKRFYRSFIRSPSVRSSTIL